MPTRTPARKKMVKKTVKKAVKAVLRAKTKARRSRTIMPKAKATVARKKVAAKVMLARRSHGVGGKTKKVKMMGKVIHFYDKISVAIVELAVPMKVGDKVMFKHGDQELVQKIGSMQIDHEAVKTAKKKQVVGVKVDKPVKDGSLVMPV